MSSLEYDPLTGLPKKKSQQKPLSFTQQQIQQSLAANPQAGFGPSPQVDYGFGAMGGFKLPGAPDYASLINNDPAYNQFKLDLGAQGVSDAASRAAQTQRAFTLFGQVPDINTLPGLNADFLNQDITPATRELAQKNTDAGLSIIARQDKAFKDQVRAIKNALASRGALRSGEAAYSLQEAQLGRDQARFDTTDALSQLIAGLQQGFAEAQRQRAAQQAQAAAEASGRVAQQYPATAPVGGNTAGQISAGGAQAAPRGFNPAPGYTPMPGEPTFQGQPGPVKPLDLEAILRTVAPPKPGEIRLPGGGGSLSYFGL